MRVNFKPAGGRYGYGFDYYCLECGEYVGNSIDSKLEHVTEIVEGVFRKTVTPINCINAGKIFELPRHEIEVTETTRKE